MRLRGGSVGQAAELAAPEWREFRGKLLDGLADPKVQRHLLAKETQKFIDEAGKEAAPKRRRAQRAVGFAAELYREALRRRAAGLRPLDPAEAARVEAVAAADENTLLDLLDRCVAAESQLDRNLALALTVECWLDDLLQIAAGQHVAPVAEGW